MELEDVMENLLSAHSSAHELYLNAKIQARKTRAEQKVREHWRMKLRPELRQEASDNPVCESYCQRAFALWGGQGDGMNALQSRQDLVKVEYFY